MISVDAVKSLFSARAAAPPPTDPADPLMTEIVDALFDAAWEYERAFNFFEANRLRSLASEVMVLYPSARRGPLCPLP